MISYSIVDDLGSLQSWMIHDLNHKGWSYDGGYDYVVDDMEKANTYGYAHDLVMVKKREKIKNYIKLI